MTNQEIQNKIEELINMDNICDFILEAQKFEKDYKQSEFYKQTKMKFTDLITTYKTIHIINYQEMYNKVQSMINNFDLEQLETVLDNFNTVASGISEEMKGELSNIKDLIQ